MNSKDAQISRIIGRTEEMSREGLESLLESLRSATAQYDKRLFYRMFPDVSNLGNDNEADDVFSRHEYPKQLEFFEAGANFSQRCFMAGNRVGKTFAGAYEMTCHLTGLYPDWWIGRRFDHPVQCWAAGKTNETTRDIIQKTLTGKATGTPGNKRLRGDGMIPGKLLGKPTWKSGVADLVDFVPITHVSGKTSEIGFKTYAQGAESFEGTAKHVIWFDEEPPIDVYSEAYIRTGTTKGIMYLTFTPLKGMSEVVQSFMPKND